MAKIETTMDHVERGLSELRIGMREIRDELREMRREHRSHFRLLFGAIIVCGLGLASLLAKGFNWL